MTVAVIDGWIDGSATPTSRAGSSRARAAPAAPASPGRSRDDCSPRHARRRASSRSSSFGVAPKATILPVQVLLDDGKGGCTGRPADVAAGIRWADRPRREGHQPLARRPGARGLRSPRPSLTRCARLPLRGHRRRVLRGQRRPAAGRQPTTATRWSWQRPGRPGKLASYSQYGSRRGLAAPGRRAERRQLHPGDLRDVALPRQPVRRRGRHLAGCPACRGARRPAARPGPRRPGVPCCRAIKSTAHPLSGAGSGLVDARAALGSAARPAPTASPTPRPIIVRPVPRPSAARPRSRPRSPPSRRLRPRRSRRRDPPCPGFRQPRRRRPLPSSRRPLRARR